MKPGEEPEDLPRAPITLEALRGAASLFAYLRPYRWKFTASLLLLFLGSLLSLSLPYLAGDLVKAARAQIEGGASAEGGWSVNQVALAMAGALALQAALAFCRAWWSIEVGENSLADLRRDTFSRLIHLPMTRHHERRVGEVLSRLSADLTGIRDMLTEGLPHFLRQTVILVGGVTLLFVTSWKLTVGMLATFPVLMVAAVLFGQRLRQVARDAQDRLAESHVVAEEALHGVAAVKAFANEGIERARYDAALRRYVQAAIRAGLYTGAFIAFIVLALFGSMVFVLWLGARLYVAGEIDEGDLTRFMLFTVFVGGAAGSFAEIYGQLQRALGSTQRVREILNEPTEDPGPDQRLALRGEVEVRNVRFRYPTRPEAEVLRGLSLLARPGERVALVGPSGAGKSTLFALLLRFFEPESGEILIDGQPAQSYGLAALRRRMAVVPQDVTLFGGTIAENIAYGMPGASEAEVLQAAKEANAHEFISAFPDGYATKVGGQGAQLSGGQRQRIAIARAILRDPAILLLDEATSSLDAGSEKLVLEALDRLMRGRTSILIAHRLSTVRSASRIYVLKEGQVVEEGAHADLMAQADGVYRNLSILQLHETVAAPHLDPDWGTTQPVG
jgi:ATP-binding cassette subfamily B protein